jgi:hypothetical protein
VRQKKARKIPASRIPRSGHSRSHGSRGAVSRKRNSGTNTLEHLEILIAERRWTEIDPVEFFRLFKSGCESQAPEMLERLVTAVGKAGGRRTGRFKSRLQPPLEKSPLPDYTYLAEIGAQLQRYQQGAAALAVLDAIQAAAGGDSTAVLEERIFSELTSRRERGSEREKVLRRSFPGIQTRAREVLSEPALRISAASAARELMLAYRPLVEQLKTEDRIRHHFGIRERSTK